MKIKLIILFLFLFFTQILKSQPTIDFTSYARYGEILYYMYSDSTAQPGSAGINQIWDFSNLSILGPKDTVFYEDPSTTPYFSAFPNSNLAARRQAGSNGYMYYYVDSSNFITLGRGDGLGPVGTIVFEDPIQGFSYPINYNSTLIDTVRITWKYSLGTPGDTVYYISQDYYTYHADGYGELRTPERIFLNTLRLHTRTEFYDTTTVTGSSPNITTNIHYQTHYRWYASDTLFTDFQFEVLLDTNINASGNTYGRSSSYQTNLPTSIEKIDSGSNALRVYPNPSRGHFQLQNDLNPNSIKVYDLRGKLVHSCFNEACLSNEYIDLSILQNGIYLLQVNRDGRETSTRIVVSK